MERIRALSDYDLSAMVGHGWRKVCSNRARLLRNRGESVLWVVSDECYMWKPLRALNKLSATSKLTVH